MYTYVHVFCIFLVFFIKYDNIITGDYLMLLDVCSDNFLFFANHTKYIDILCYIVIFVCILMCLFIKNKKLLKNTKNIFKTKIVMFTSALIFFVFISLVFISSINKVSYDGCYCEASLGLKIVPKKEIKNSSINEIVSNKVIVVGDSRMEYIVRDENMLKVPINFSFIAKSGAKIDWFENVALYSLKNKLNNLDDNYTYHVIVNMGVNDLADDINIKKRAYEYFSDYENLSLEYPNVNFYLLSINPVDDSIINKYFKTNKRSNKKIESFNYEMNNFLLNSKSNNLYSCDSYNSLYFKLSDGLHYDLATEQEILDYITNKCISYK